METRKGLVKFYNKEKAFGFISREGESDIFFHKNQVKTKQDLIEGDAVEFEICEGKKGPCAENVQYC